MVAGFAAPGNLGAANFFMEDGMNLLGEKEQNTKLNPLFWVHELAMVVPTSEGIYAPSRLQAPYQVPLSKLLLMNIRQMPVSLEPDGVSNPQVLNVRSGAVTGLPYLLVYDDGFVNGNGKFLPETYTPLPWQE